MGIFARQTCIVGDVVRDLENLTIRKDIALSHKFTVGQVVDLAPRLLQAAAAGQYEVCRLMPMLDRDPTDPVYRIKSLEEKHERVAMESDLTLSA
jgi:hypothetical protein